MKTTSGTHTVESWYDRKTRSWVTQTKDSNEFQVGDASYSGSKSGRDADHQRHIIELK